MEIVFEHRETSPDELVKVIKDHAMECGMDAPVIPAGERNEINIGIPQNVYALLQLCIFERMPFMEFILLVAEDSFIKGINQVQGNDIEFEAVPESACWKKKNITFDIIGKKKEKGTTGDDMKIAKLQEELAAMDPVEDKDIDMRLERLQSTLNEDNGTEDELIAAEDEREKIYDTIKSKMKENKPTTWAEQFDRGWAGAAFRINAGRPTEPAATEKELDNMSATCAAFELGYDTAARWYKKRVKKTITKQKSSSSSIE